MAILSREAADVLNYTSTMLKVRVVEPAFRLAMNNNSNSNNTSTSTSTSTRNTCSEHSSVKTTSTKTTTRPPRKPTLTEVRVLLQLWKRALVWGDAEAVASRYSPTAIMTPLLGNEHAGVVVPLQGRDAIQSYFEQTFLPKHRPKEIKVLKGNVSLLGERIHDNGIYDITTQSGRIMRMKYIFVYARDPTSNGHWRIVHHKSSLIGDIPTIKTPRDNHAKHDRTILQEHEQGSSSSQTTACKDDNRATHVRSIGPVSPVEEDETEESSSICSEIIPWGSFPYEDERYPMIETADTSTSSMSTLTRLSSVVTTSTISTLSTHDSRIEKDVSPKAPKRRLSLSSTSDFVEEYYAPLKGEEEEPPRAPEDKSPKIPRRRLSIGHNLVDFVTSHEEPRHEVVRNHNKRTVVPDNNTTTRTTAPKRRRSEVDRLVGLLTGTESVSQSQLIILSVNNNNNNNQSNNNDDPANETVVEPVIEYVVPNRRPSEVEHLVGLLTGSKPVSQSDLIFLSVDNNKKENELYASDIDASHRIPQ